jgi:hypothetical protein
VYGKTFFQNHASIIHKYYDGKIAKYLITDPWVNSPAFGSWLPSFPPVISNDRLLSLALDKRLIILISHAHDDHCDDEFLKIFPKNITIIIPKFKGPGLRRRLEKLGFQNINEISSNATRLEGINFHSFINEDLSLDDAVITIETSSETLIHNNDNWFEYNEETLKVISEIVGKQKDKNKVLFMSQTNSASGFPFAYNNFDSLKKLDINIAKVKKMIETGIRNCLNVGGTKFLSYAGYASVYVKEHPEYLSDSINPTPKWISENCNTCSVDIIDMLPGDLYEFEQGTIQEHFMKDAIESENYSAARNSIYRIDKVIDKCDTYKITNNIEYTNIEQKLEYFLLELNKFVLARMNFVDFFGGIEGKCFKIQIKNSMVNKSLIFGSGLQKIECAPDKSVIVPIDLMFKILEGELLFENLYTGYEGEWSRKDDYNRDIVMALVMFSYFYKNNLMAKKGF